jgi:8-oxo-dGTP pyrophosphatase MutT (NUDIX family)
MNQNYVIFIEGHTLSLIHSAAHIRYILTEVDGKLFRVSECAFADHIKRIIGSLLQHNNQQASVYYHDIRPLMKKLQSVFPKHIIAAGGIVVNNSGNILFIFRNGYWDLPKGKIEPDENPEKAAVREISEETGIVHATLIRKLPVTFHTYFDKGTLVLKETRWFEIHSDDTELTPQTEEGITEIKWVSRAELAHVLSKSYESIRWLINNYLASSTL